MEKYEINGVEVEYDTFDLVNMELFDSEFRRVTGTAQAQQQNGVGPEGYLAAMRELAEAITDAFDVLLGEGASARLFGGRTNIRDIAFAWNRFTADVADRMARLAEGVEPPAAPPAAPVPDLNREQRRAAEREQRRQRARETAEARRA